MYREMKTTKDLWHLSFISCLEIREYFGEDKCGDEEFYHCCEDDRQEIHTLVICNMVALARDMILRGEY